MNEMALFRETGINLSLRALCTVANFLPPLLLFLYSLDLGQNFDAFENLKCPTASLQSFSNLHDSRILCDEDEVEPVNLISCTPDVNLSLDI